MIDNLNTSDETNYLPVAMFQLNLSFQASSLFQSKNNFSKWEAFSQNSHPSSNELLSQIAPLQE